MTTQKSRCHIVVTGTDPNSAQGGIGVVLPGYFTALQIAGYNYECMPTYRPTSIKGKWFLWLKALSKLSGVVRGLLKDNNQVIVYSHVGDGVSFFRETCVLWVAKLAGAQTIQQIHSPKVDSYLDHVVKNILFKVALLPVDTVCVLTTWWEERLVGAGVKKTIHVIPNPLPDNLLSMASKTKEEKEVDEVASINILSMARLVPGKGVDIMIRAIEYLPLNVNLTIAGDGNQRKILENLTCELGVSERVKFCGWVSGEEKNKLLNKADIFCLPSTYDAFPMSMVEAMAFGIPVVAVSWGGIPDMVSDGYSGFLAANADEGEISDTIKKLLSADVRQKMGVQAKQWVIDISHPEQVAKKLTVMIEGLLA